MGIDHEVLLKYDISEIFEADYFISFYVEHNSWHDENKFLPL